MSDKFVIYQPEGAVSWLPQFLAQGDTAAEAIKEMNRFIVDFCVTFNVDYPSDIGNSLKHIHICEFLVPSYAAESVH